jgi:hypothetical protein
MDGTAMRNDAPSIQDCRVTRFHIGDRRNTKGFYWSEVVKKFQDEDSKDNINTIVVLHGDFLKVHPSSLF